MMTPVILGSQLLKYLLFHDCMSSSSLHDCDSPFDKLQPLQNDITHDATCWSPWPHPLTLARSKVPWQRLAPQA